MALADLQRGAAEPSLPAGPWRAHYTLLVLTLVYLCSNIDRNLMAVLLEPIRREFQLSDTQLGLLSGTAFAIVFSTAGIPLGMLADRVSRRRMISAALVVWSTASALCGWAQNFTHLMLCRVGVGAGEAGGSPAGMSMVSDLYPAQSRGTAMAFYYLATAVGAAAAFSAGGVLAQHYGWRAAFVILSVPGFALALLVLMTVRDPERGSVQTYTLAGTLRFIGAQPALMLVFAALMINSFVASGLSAWITSFLIRGHGMTLQQAGPLVGLIYGVLGVAGTFLGGVLADRFGRRDERGRAWLLGGATLLTVPSVAVLTLSAGQNAALVGLCGFALLSSVPFGAGYALAQSLARPTMRATSSSIMYLLTNLIGYGLGAPAIGFGSDHFGGNHALGTAILTFCSANLLSALCYFLATSSLRANLRAAAAV